ncbi:MAG: preprotein translocase subunit SecG [Bacteroidia bacterium]|nr:preprotein translocase subunit SecG [Bacteroidia bacterium]HQV00722.1 preprotein translocase subunit SecG [Bacteroidia bacterium]
MYLFITILIFLASILLSLVVLIQSSKGGGLAAGLSSSNQVMGVRKTTEGLEKLTWGFGIALMVLVLVATFSLPNSQTSATGTTTTKQSTTLERAAKTNVPQAAPAPQQQAAPPASK